MTLATVPSWWFELTTSASELLELMREVVRHGAAKNDRTAVERIWHELRVRLVAERLDAERGSD
jgi:hypothetical protein